MPRVSSPHLNDENFLTTQLKSNVKSKLNYVNNVCVDLTEMIQKMHLENNDLKVLIGILMHFKHMFLYAKNNNFLQEEEIYEKLGIDSTLFKNDLSQCEVQFNQMIDKCKNMKFVQKKDKYYEKDQKYHSFVEDDFLTWKENEQRRSETIEKHNLRSGVRQKQQWSGEVDRIEVGPDISFVLSDDDKDWAANDDANYSDDEDFVPASKATKRNSNAANSSTKHARNINSNKRISVIRDNKRKSDERINHTAASYKRPSTQIVEANVLCEEDYDYDEDDELYQPSAFKCPVEGCVWQPFDRRKDLNIHLFDGHSIAPYACLVDGCSVGFESRSSMLSHLKIHQNTYICCDRCQKTFQADYFSEHYQKEHARLKTDNFTDGFNVEDSQYSDQNTDEAHQCAWSGCGLTFNSGKELQDHISSHATVRIHRARTLGNTGKRYRCKWENCELKYITDNRSHITRHVRSRHLGLPRYLKDQLEKNIYDERNVSDYFEIIDAVVTSSQPAAAASTEPDGEQRHYCRWVNCERSFQSKYELKEHLQQHVSRTVTQYRCRTCAYQSGNKNHVLRHIRSRHFGLPRSYKEQIEKNIVDQRNPYDYMDILDVTGAPPEPFQQLNQALPPQEQTHTPPPEQTHLPQTQVSLLPPAQAPQIDSQAHHLLSQSQEVHQAVHHVQMMTTIPMTHHHEEVVANELNHSINHMIL